MDTAKLTPWDAAIFDYGGVLSYAPLRQEVAELAANTGVSEPAFFKLYSNTRDYYGRSPEEYTRHWLRVADAVDVRISASAVEEFIAVESELWVKPNAEALALARAIKAGGIKTAILSNMTFDLLGRLREKLDWLGEFDVQVWSCEVGCSKPDIAIYRECLGALNCEAPRALFFDDRPRNVNAARQVGMDAYVFESAERARAIVERGLKLA